MGTVTIAATFGAGGSVVAPAVAEQLGLPLIDRAIPVRLAEKLDHPLMRALAHDERAHGSAVRRLFEKAVAHSGLFVGVPTPLDQLGADRHVAATEEALRRIASSEGAVILGRAAVFVLKGRPDTLHVRLDGPVEVRRLQAMAHEGLDYEAARRQQEQTDRARAAYVSHFHPDEGAWEDPRHYDLMLDSTRISLEACSEIIVAAARDLFARATGEALSDQSLE